MAEGPRRGSRSVKLRQDKDFIYEESLGNLLLGREDKVEASRTDRTSSHNSRRSADVETSEIINLGNYNTVALSENWSNLYDNLVRNNNSNLLSSESTAGAISSLSLSRSQSPVRGTDAEGYFVNIGSDRHNSSTRLDFLDVEDQFLSVSPTVRTDTSDMEKDNCGECDACIKGLTCTIVNNVSMGKNDTISNKEVMQTLWAAVGNVDKLADKVISLERHIRRQDEKIDSIIESSKEDSSQESTTKVETRPGKAKENRVEEEKARQLKLLQERLRAEKGSSSAGNEDSSEAELVDLKAIKKKMSKKQRDLCGRRVTARLNQAGAVFPSDDFETSSTGTVTDIDQSCRHKKLIKSGAKIKKRPVVQTELWPHPIANEEDGEEVTCENISLAKFFSCFSYIVVSCSSKIESRGRSALLHAVSIVLEYLHWSDARTFHNLTMVKIEQGRLDWASDFSGLAETFIDKKVRLSMKTKRYPAGASSSYKSGNSSRNIGKGYSSNFKSNGDTGRNKSLHGVICWQWNNGTCTYGDNCKRWHACKVCTKAGKLGESHKA